MKNIFDLDIKKGQDAINGSAFITQRISYELEEESKAISRKVVSMYDKSTVPLWITFIQVLAMVIGFPCLFGIFNKDTGLNIGFLVVAIVCTSICLGIGFWDKMRQKKFTKEIEENEIFTQLDNMQKRLKEELQVPEEIIEVDIFYNSYEIKKGKRQNLIKEIADYENEAMIFYERENRICFLMSGCEITIPISSIKTIEEVKKTVSFPIWNKEEQYNDPKYKAYEITENKSGIYWIKMYYAIQIQSIWGDYEILVPSYEETFINHIQDLIK